MRDGRTHGSRPPPPPPPPPTFSSTTSVSAPQRTFEPEGQRPSKHVGHGEPDRQNPPHTGAHHKQGPGQCLPIPKLQANRLHRRPHGNSPKGSRAGGRGHGSERGRVNSTARERGRSFGQTGRLRSARSSETCPSAHSITAMCPVPCALFTPCLWPVPSLCALRPMPCALCWRKGRFGAPLAQPGVVVVHTPSPPLILPLYTTCPPPPRLVVGVPGVRATPCAPRANRFGLCDDCASPRQPPVGAEIVQFSFQAAFGDHPFAPRSVQRLCSDKLGTPAVEAVGGGGGGRRPKTVHTARCTWS